MTIESIIALVATTGIGAAIYGGLELAKPWLKLIAGLPWIKRGIDWFTVRFVIAETDMAKVYDALIKAIVFVLAWTMAWQMGAKGDLLVLLEYNLEPSYIGYAVTACVVAFGDLILDYIEQRNK